MAGRHVPFALAYLKLNLASAMEYRVAFFTQIAAMALNDALMLVFWWMYF